MEIKLFKNNLLKIKNLISTTGIGFVDLYDKGEKHISKWFKPSFKFLCYLISPTWWIAKISNEKLNSDDRAKAITARNYFYLLSSITYCLVFGFAIPSGVSDKLSGVFGFVIIIVTYIIPWSRCNEILFAFINDALEKTSGDKNKSSLTYRKRIELSLLSYIELIMNYALMYYIMPLNWFETKSGCFTVPIKETSCSFFNSIIDSIYFSAVTITTIGYGDFTPKYFIAKFTVIHQVIVGFTLIVVSFAIYAGKGLSNDNSNQNSPNK